MLEKIDVINGIIYLYDDKFQLIKSIDINTLEGLDLSYLNGSKLFTFNLNQPVKRVVKFTELNSLTTTAEFIEFLYEPMTDQQKLDFDNFVLLINSLI